MLPFLEKQCDVLAVELGGNLAEFVQHKYADYTNFKVIQGDFMKIAFPDNSRKLIYSATAFHWLPAEEACRKIIKVLEPGGTLALFWNHPYPNRIEDASNRINREIYQKYCPSDKPLKEFTERDLEKRCKELMNAGFHEVTAQLYRRRRILTSRDYIGLLNTYSDHRSLPEDVRLAFEEDMCKSLDQVGGFITIYDTLDLYLARKK